MKIVELFQNINKSFEWEMDADGGGRTVFQIDNHTVELDIRLDQDFVDGRNPHPQANDVVDAAWHAGVIKQKEIEEDARGFYISFDIDDRISITGNLATKAVKVFSEIISATIDFLSKTDWDYITFTAKEPSRIRLYSALANRLTKHISNVKIMSNNNGFLIFKPGVL